MVYSSNSADIADRTISGKPWPSVGAIVADPYLRAGATHPITCASVFPGRNDILLHRGVALTRVNSGHSAPFRSAKADWLEPPAEDEIGSVLGSDTPS